MVICDIFVSMVFSCIPFSMGFNINYTVIFCNFVALVFLLLETEVLQTSAV